MIRIFCRQADAILKETQTLTSGMTNYPEVVLTFSQDWDGFGKAVVVRAGTADPVSVLITNNKFIIPAECLAQHGVNLSVGISGTNGVETIPTIWCAVGEIYEGADIDEASNIGEATLTLVEQMLGYAGACEDSAGDAADSAADAASDAHDAALDAAAAAESAAAAYQDAEVWAKGTRGGVPVEEGQDGYHDNSKYYKELADTDADTASAKALVSEGYAVGTQGGEAVSSDSPYYENNAKYMKEQAAAYTLQADSFSGESAAWATGSYSGGDTPVPGTAPQHNNNAKYYSQQASSSASSASDSATSADDSAEDAEAYAKGTRDGEAVGSSDPAYHNNSKYYSEQASTSATNAASSELNALGYEKVSERYAKGTEDGSPVASGIGYQDNAKYYKELADDDATSASSSAASAGTDALKAEGYAVGKQNGADVASGSTYYHNNAAYYAGEASNSATNAGTSETNASGSASSASTNALKAEGYAVGKQNGTDVTSGSTYYQNNAKYYADEAADSATAAATSAATFETDTTLSVSGKAADAKVTGDNFTQLSTSLSFYEFGKITSRIDWDTVNKTVTIGNGFFIYGGGYKTISSAITLNYTSFANTTVLLYDGNTFLLKPFNNLVAGYAVALFDSAKMYMPFDYSKVYVDGEKITTANLFNDFTTFIDETNTDLRLLEIRTETIEIKLSALAEENIIYEQNNSTWSYATSDNIWVINETPIPEDTFITTIDAYVGTGEKQINVSLWNVDTGAKYFNKTYTLSPINGVVTIPLNYKTTASTKIGFSTDTQGVTVSGLSGHSLIYVDKAATSITGASTLNGWVVNATIKAITLPDTSVLSQEIHVGEGLEYEEIQPAIEAISDYGTIIVHPKNTPYQRFSLMRSLSSAYPWSGLSTVKHISIIGVDKAKCIIKSDTGNYVSPPAEIATNGIIKNLTFIATHTASDGTETTGSYAVHVDNRPADQNGMKLVFENCDFISYQTAAVGLGLYRNQDITFDSCNFKSYTDSTWKPSEDYDSSYMCALGAYFMHTTMGYAGGNMFIRFRNCFLYHEGGSYAMRIADADDTQTALLEAINNTLWDATNETTGYYTTSSPIMQMPYNHGNNATGLNA